MTAPRTELLPLSRWRRYALHVGRGSDRSYQPLCKWRKLGVKGYVAGLSHRSQGHSSPSGTSSRKPFTVSTMPKLASTALTPRIKGEAATIATDQSTMAISQAVSAHSKLGLRT